MGYKKCQRQGVRRKIEYSPWRLCEVVRCVVMMSLGLTGVDSIKRRTQSSLNTKSPVEHNGLSMCLCCRPPPPPRWRSKATCRATAAAANPDFLEPGFGGRWLVRQSIINCSLIGETHWFGSVSCPTGNLGYPRQRELHWTCDGLADDSYHSIHPWELTIRVIARLVWVWFAFAGVWSFNVIQVIQEPFRVSVKLSFSTILDGYTGWPKKVSHHLMIKKSY